MPGEVVLSRVGRGPRGAAGMWRGPHLGADQMLN